MPIGRRSQCRGTCWRRWWSRVEELFQLVHEQIKRSGFEPLLRSGIALTGGSAMLPGMVELGEGIPHAGAGGSA